MDTGHPAAWRRCQIVSRAYGLIIMNFGAAANAGMAELFSHMFAEKTCDVAHFQENLLHNSRITGQKGLTEPVKPLLFSVGPSPVGRPAK